MSLTLSLGAGIYIPHMFTRVTAKVIVPFILWEVIRRNNEPLLDITQSFKGWEMGGELRVFFCGFSSN